MPTNQKAFATFMKPERGFAHLFLILLLLVGVGVGVYLVQHPAIFKPKADQIINPLAEHLIGKTIINGKPFLFNRASGRIFIPRGNNYSNNQQVPDPWNPGKTGTSGWEWFSSKINPATGKSYYDSNRDQIESDLIKMEQDGYNSVRISISTISIGNTAGNGLDPQVLKNIAEFIQKAKNHHIFVLISAAELPRAGGYTP